MSGGAGNDLLDGGRGNDRLEGGAGMDRFVFGKSIGVNVILDFDKLHDSLVLNDGQSVGGSRTVDANLDGLADLYVELSGGGSIALLGIDSLDGVAIEHAYAIGTQGWRETGADLALLAPPPATMHGLDDMHHVMSMTQAAHAA